MLMLLGLTISTPLPQGVTTSVLLRGTSWTAPAAATVGAGAAGAVVGCAAAAGAVVGAAAGAEVGAAAGAVVGLAAAAGGAVAAGAGACGALWHAVANKTRLTPKRTKG